MTQIDIAALVADREAGTKGPWFAESGHVQQNGQLYWQVTDGYDAITQNQFCWCRGNHAANARRIARVPDLEAALIAQDSELRRLQAEIASLRASQADAEARGWNNAMLTAISHVAESRNVHAPGPIFKVLNETMGKIDDARFAGLRRYQNDATEAETKGEA